ncbi:hypothetical protein C0991_008846 [Blastosporella zonata]|nr:hypothetical protein C0991_008846 [Blastosporella zonata]
MDNPSHDQVRDVIDRLQRPVPDLSTLLSLLCSPLDSLGLLPPQYRRYNHSRLPSGSLKIQRHLPTLQRAILGHIAPTWDSALAEEKASLLVDQYFCPDSFSFAYSSAGDVAIMAYATITSQPLTQYGIHILTRLAFEYPVDRLHSALFKAKKLDPAVRMLAWEDCVRSILAVPGKVSNTIAGKTSVPVQLEHGHYYNNICVRTESLVFSLSEENSTVPRLTHATDAKILQRITVKTEATILSGITGSVVPERDELWESAMSIILGKEWDTGHARIFVCWIFGGPFGSSRNEKALDAFVEQVLSTWSSPDHVKHSLLSRHRYMTSLLLIAISYLSPSSEVATTVSLSPLFISGIGLYVGHLDPSVRRCGMLAAEVVAQRAGKKLDFGDWDGDDAGKPWARELRELIEERDIDAKLSDIESPESIHAENVEEIIAPGATTRATFSGTPDGYDSDDSITGYASPSSSRSASPTPSELDSIEKDPTLNVGTKKVPRPVYLVQLGDLLRSTGGAKSSTEPHDADKIEMALTCAEELIRKKKDYGTELDENAVNLVYGLIGLQDNYELEDFELKRQGALNAIIACSPRKAAPTLIQEFFKNQYSTSQRYVALNALALGAREMASLPLPPSQVAPARISFPSKMLPAPLHQQYLGEGTQQLIPLIMDSISTSAIDKGKDTSADKVPEIVRERRLRINKAPGISLVSPPGTAFATALSAMSPKLTPFIEVATEYFITPLINHFWLFLRDERTREDRTAHQKGRQQYHGAGTGLILNPVVLSHFLRTLGILVHAAQNAPEWMALVAPEALELAVTIGTRPVSRIETDTEDDEELGHQRGKEASVLTAALELALVVLDGCLDIDGGRVIGLEHTTLLLGIGEWAGGIFGQVEKGVKLQGGGGAHETKLRRAAAGVLLKIDDLTSKWRRSMLDTR